MDKLDKEILNEIQWTFPLVPRPYTQIAKKFELSNEQLMQRLHDMKKSGVIRQMSAIFDTRRLGYKSALVAMAVEPEKLDAVANQVNKHRSEEHTSELQSPVHLVC